MKKILAFVLMAAVLVCPAFASGEASGNAAPAAQPAAAAPAAAADQATCAHAFAIADVVPSTCTESGLLTYSCGKCGLTYTVEIAAKGHTRSAAAATCDAAVVCTTCGTVLEPATGHAYAYQYDAVQNADGTFASFGTWKCDNCGDVVEATEGNAAFYMQQEAPAASEEPAPASGEPAPASDEPASAEPASGEASAEEPVATVANPDYDPSAYNWTSIELIMAAVIVVVAAVLMLSFGKGNPAAKKKED